MQVIKLSLPGIKVTEATPEQCVIHSKYNSPKIDATKGHFVNINLFFANEPPDPTAGNTLETSLFSFPHGYSYKPQVWLHVDYTSEFGSTFTEEFGPGKANLGAVTAEDSCFLGVRADSTNCKVYIQKTASIFSEVLHVAGSSVKLRLYIFAEMF